MTAWLLAALRDLTGPVVVLAIGGFLARTFINRQVTKSVDAYKADLQRVVDKEKLRLEALNQEKIEKLKAELSSANQRDVERWKADLSQQNDALRHGLQIELVKVQSAHAKKHDIYPQVFEKLTVAYGAIGHLMGPKFAESFDTYDRADFETLLNGMEVTIGEKNRLMEEIDRNRKTGIEELGETRRRIELNQARKEYVEAMNLLLLKSLYMKPDLVELAREALKELWGAWVSAQMTPQDPRIGKDFQPHMATARAKLDAIEKAMRESLTT